MQKILLTGVVGLLFSFSYVASSASADTPGYRTASYPNAASYEPFTELPSPTPAPDSCWDCEGSTMTDAEKLAAACSPEVLAANPQHLDLCFPNQYVWTCHPDGTCRFETPGPTPYNGLDIPTTLPSPTPTPSVEPTPPESPAPTPEATPLPTESP